MVIILNTGVKHVIKVNLYKVKVTKDDNTVDSRYLEVIGTVKKISR
jgi:hypothetical protein